MNLQNMRVVELGLKKISTGKGISRSEEGSAVPGPWPCRAPAGRSRGGRGRRCSAGPPPFPRRGTCPNFAVWLERYVRSQNFQISEIFEKVIVINI